MGMYMYKMNVNYDKEIVRETKSHEIPELMDLKFIMKVVGEKDVFVIEDEKIIVHTKRLETDKEQQKRIKHAEDYNKRYDEYHSKNSNGRMV